MRTIQQTRKEDGRLKERMTDMTANTSYSYLLNGLESSTSAPWFSGNSFSSTYFPNGLLNTLTLANSATTARTYDLSNREASLTAKKSDGTILSSWLNIAYDEADNRTQESVVQAQPSGSPQGGRRGLRLRQAEPADIVYPSARPVDQLGQEVCPRRRRKRHRRRRLHIHHNRNRLTERVELSTLAKTTFGYDNLGNQISETTGSNVTTTSYDAASHPNRVSLPDSRQDIVPQ